MINMDFNYGNKPAVDFVYEYYRLESQRDALLESEVSQWNLNQQLSIWQLGVKTRVKMFVRSIHRVKKFELKVIHKRLKFLFKKSL